MLVLGVLGGRWSGDGSPSHVTSRLALIGGTSACHMAVSHTSLLFVHTLTCLSSIAVDFCNSLSVSPLFRHVVRHVGFFQLRLFSSVECLAAELVSYLVPCLNYHLPLTLTQIHIHQILHT